MVVKHIKKAENMKKAERIEKNFLKKLETQNFKMLISIWFDGQDEPTTFWVSDH